MKADGWQLVLFLLSDDIGWPLWEQDLREDSPPEDGASTYTAPPRPLPRGAQVVWKRWERNDGHSNPIEHELVARGRFAARPPTNRRRKRGRAKLRRRRRFALERVIEGDFAALNENFTNEATDWRSMGWSAEDLKLLAEQRDRSRPAS